MPRTPTKQQFARALGIREPALKAHRTSVFQRIGCLGLGQAASVSG
jgi:DNA-binding CsgD family transcriptional regulator